MKRIYLFCGLPLALLLFGHFYNRSAQPQTVTQNLSAEPAYSWKLQTAAADFPKSYNFQLFSRNDTLWAFHPAGTWFSADGRSWQRSPLGNSILNLAFLDYVSFQQQILGLGQFRGNIEQFQFKPIISSTTDLRNWNTIASNSNFPQRFFSHPFVFKNKIWMIGGSDGNQNYDDAWSSVDGIHWKQEATQLPFGKREGSQVVQLGGTLFLLNNDVWTSTDALHWEKVTNEIVTGEEIFGYTAVVFDEQIWLLGCNRNGRFKSEILVSKDGKNWTAQRAPWSPRGGIAACVHNNKLYVTGGKYGGQDKNGETEFIYSNDVWCLEKNN